MAKLLASLFGPPAFTCEEVPLTNADRLRNWEGIYRLSIRSGAERLTVHNIKS